MRCPILNKLPSPPPGKTGWPWTEESPQLPNKMEEGCDWPKISIVTPSYNQGRFIEETIRSVLLQGYPNLEYIIIDGGSTDNSVEIIKKYEPWLTYWVSEPDRGQSHGINKGFEKAAGEVFGWLNSDDYFHPGALGTLMTFRQAHLDAVAWAGAGVYVDINGAPLHRGAPRVGNKAQIGDWEYGACFYQPSCLFSAELFHAVGGLDEGLHIALDIDLWLRFAETGRFAAIDEVISYSRMYPEIKSLRDIPLRVVEEIVINWKNSLPEISKRILLRYAERPIHPYRDLVKYFAKRTIEGIWRRIRPK
jgi:glycosyltransferase involved in cell wall biosynthesis